MVVTAIAATFKALPFTQFRKNKHFYLWYDGVYSVLLAGALAMPLTWTAVDGAENSVASWHQEARDLCLLMTRKIGRPVRMRLSRAHSDDCAQRMKDDVEQLARQHELRCVLEIPDAAAPVTVVADLKRRSVRVSMTLAAPRDRKRASSRINWILRQLARTSPDGIEVRALWPGRAPATQVSLGPARENPALLEVENKALAPTQFEVILVRDLAGKFAGTRTFIEQLEDAVPHFYEQVGQYLRAYVAPPPRLRREQGEADGAASLEEVAEEATEISTDAAEDVSVTTDERTGVG
jgi:hypothetical protein